MKINLTNTEIGTISTMSDWGMKIVLYTPELSVEDMTSLLQAKKQWIADEIEFDADLSEKSPSQRLRWVLYILWEQLYKNQYKTFVLYYNHIMEQLIDLYKSKLEPKENDFTN